MKKKWKLRKTVHIVIVIAVVQFVIGIYSIHLADECSKKVSTAYQLIDQGSVQQVLPEQEQSFSVYTNFKELKVLSVPLLDIRQVQGSGNIECVICDEHSIEVITKKNTFEEVYNSGSLDFDMSNVKDTMNQTFVLRVRSHFDVPLSVSVSNHGYLNVKEIYDFQYYKLVKVGIVTLNIIVLMIAAILVTKIRIEKKFLVLSLVLGFGAVFFIAPCSAPDEWRHFIRAYDIAQGNMICDEIVDIDETQTTGVCVIPIEYLDIKNTNEMQITHWTDESNSKICIPKFLSLFAKVNESGEKSREPIPGTYDKSLIEYFPQVLFIVIAKFCKMTPILVFYMARIGNLLAASCAGYFAIKIIPRYKYLLMGLYFLPVMTFLRSTSSTDGMLYSSILLFIAYTLHLKYKGRNVLSLKHLMFYIGIVTYIAVLKLPYVFFCLLILLTESEDCKFRGYVIKAETAKFLFTIMILGSAIFIRTMIAGMFSSPLATVQEVSLGDLMEYIIHHKLLTLSLLVRTFLDDALNMIIDGSAWPYGGIYFFAYMIVLGVICVNGDSFSWKKWERIFLISLACFIWSLIIIVFFMKTSIGADKIWGLQGRYLTPMFGFIELAASVDRSDHDSLTFKIAPVLILGCNVIYFIHILLNYWFFRSV